MNEIELIEITKLLNIIPETELYSPTFMEIGGYHHKENIYSNILRFFLNPQNEHGFNNHLLNDFLNAIGLEEWCNYDNKSVIIDREVSTDNGRIDLLIRTNQWTLIIENKIYHTLNNDLEDYLSYVIREKHNHNESMIKLIVLSLYPEKIESKYINFTYKELYKLWEHHIQSIDKSNDYQIYFNQFLKTIKNLAMAPTITNEELLFIQSNADNIEKIVNLNHRFEQYINGRVNNLISLINKSANCENFEGYDLVLYFKFGNIEYKIECCFEIGAPIYLTLATCDNKANEHVFKDFNWFKSNPINKNDYNITNDRLFLDRNISWDKSDEEISDIIKLWFERLK